MHEPEEYAERERSLSTNFHSSRHCLDRLTLKILMLRPERRLMVLVPVENRKEDCPDFSLRRSSYSSTLLLAPAIKIDIYARPYVLMGPPKLSRRLPLVPGQKREFRVIVSRSPRRVPFLQPIHTRPFTFRLLKLQLFILHRRYLPINMSTEISTEICVQRCLQRFCPLTLSHTTSYYANLAAPTNPHDILTLNVVISSHEPESPYPPGTTLSVRGKLAPGSKGAMVTLQVSEHLRVDRTLANIPTKATLTVFGAARKMARDEEDWLVIQTEWDGPAIVGFVLSFVALLNSTLTHPSGSESPNTTFTAQPSKQLPLKTLSSWPELSLVFTIPSKTSNLSWVSFLKPSPSPAAFPILPRPMASTMWRSCREIA